MKARILPLEEIAEYGKTDAVVLALSINSTEAGILLDMLNDGISERNDPTPATVRYLVGILETIRDRAESQFRQDAINTEGRSITYINSRADNTALRGYLA